MQRTNAASPSRAKRAPEKHGESPIRELARDPDADPQPMRPLCRDQSAVLTVVEEGRGARQQKNNEFDLSRRSTKSHRRFKWEYCKGWSLTTAISTPRGKANRATIEFSFLAGMAMATGCLPGRSPAPPAPALPLACLTDRCMQLGRESGATRGSSSQSPTGPIGKPRNKFRMSTALWDRPYVPLAASWSLPGRTSSTRAFTSRPMMAQIGPRNCKSLAWAAA